MYIDEFVSDVPESIEELESFEDITAMAYDMLEVPDVLGNIVVRDEDGMLRYLNVNVELVPVCDLPEHKQAELLGECLITPDDI